jgi:hypothetical protein
VRTLQAYLITPDDCRIKVPEKLRLKLTKERVANELEKFVAILWQF